MGAMVGCEIVNEASNGTTRWGSGMDRLAHTRPAPRKDHIQCDLTNQQITHKPEENVTTIFLSLLWTSPTLIRMMVKLARLERLLWSGRSLEDPPLHRDCRCSQKRWGKILTTPQLNSMPLNYTSLKQPVEHRCLFPSETFLSSFIAP